MAAPVAAREQSEEEVGLVARYGRAAPTSPTTSSAAFRCLRSLAQQLGAHPGRRACAGSRSSR